MTSHDPPWLGDGAGSAIDQHVGQRLQEQRQRAGIAADRIGQVLGVSVDRLADWEAGRTRIPAHHLLAVSQLLSCSLTVFFEDFIREPRGVGEVEFSESQVDWLFTRTSDAKH